MTGLWDFSWNVNSYRNRVPKANNCFPARYNCGLEAVFAKQAEMEKALKISTQYMCKKCSKLHKKGTNLFPSLQASWLYGVSYLEGRGQGNCRNGCAQRMTWAGDTHSKNSWPNHCPVDPFQLWNMTDKSKAIGLVLQLHGTGTQHLGNFNWIFPTWQFVWKAPNTQRMWQIKGSGSRLQTSDSAVKLADFCLTSLLSANHQLGVTHTHFRSIETKNILFFGFPNPMQKRHIPI